jgi:hypothetical protein
VLSELAARGASGGCCIDDDKVCFVEEGSGVYVAGTTQSANWKLRLSVWEGVIDRRGIILKKSTRPDAMSRTVISRRR